MDLRRLAPQTVCQPAPTRRAHERRPRLLLVVALLAACLALVVVPAQAKADGTEMEGWYEAGRYTRSSKAPVGTTKTYSTCVTTVTKNGLNVKMTQDVTLDDYWYVWSSSTITLDLNGHTLKRDLAGKVRWGSVIVLCGSSKLQIVDTSEAQTGLITGGKSSNTGGGIYLWPGSPDELTKLTVLGGTISGNESSCGGGGIYASGNGLVSLQGTASVENNNADGHYGGGVYLANSCYFSMYENARICNNSCVNGGYGGGLYIDGALTSGVLKGSSSIYGNKASYGGGVYLHDTFLSSGNEDIVYNKAFIVGGQSSIKNNTALKDGGGVYVDDGSWIGLGDSYDESSISITGNTAIRGAGIYADSGFFHDSRVQFGRGTVRVTDNYSTSGAQSNLALAARSVRLIPDVTSDGALGQGSRIGITVPDLTNGQTVVKPKSTDAKYYASNETFKTTSGMWTNVDTLASCFVSDKAGWEFRGVAAMKKGESSYGGISLTAYKTDSATSPRVTHGYIAALSFKRWDIKIGTDTIEFTVPFGTDVTKLKPSFVLADATTSCYWVGEQEISTSEPMDFSKPVHLFVDNVSESGTSYRSFYTVSVTVAEQTENNVCVVANDDEYSIDECPATAKEAETVNVKVTPKPGHVFKGWKVRSGGVTLADSGSAATSFVMEGDDVVLEPDVRPMYYDVTLKGPNGGYYWRRFAVGEELWLEAPKIKGMHFVGWELPQGYTELAGDDVKKIDLAKGTAQWITLGYVEGQGDDTEVVFVAKMEADTYAVSVSGGTIVSVDGTAVAEGTTSGAYVAGTELVVEPTVPDGQKLLQWAVSAGDAVTYSGTSSLKYTVGSQDVSIEAQFVNENAHTLTVEGGSGSGVYEEGQTAHVAANVPEGYEFAGWKASDGLALSAEQAAAVETDVTMPSGDAVLTAKFQAIDYTISVADGSVWKVVRDGQTVMNTPSATATVHVGDVVTLGYKSETSQGGSFYAWNATSGSLTPVGGTSNQFVVGAGDVSVTTLYYYKLTTENASPSGQYVQGSTVTLTADLDDGQKAGSWELSSNITDAVYSADNATVTFTMPAGAASAAAQLETAEYELSLTGATVFKVVRDDVDITGSYGGKLRYGDVVSLMPDNDDLFVGWNDVSWSPLAWVVGGGDTFVMPAEDVTLVAMIYYPLTVIGGTADAEYYEAGEKAVITANADEGEFKGWEVVSGLSEDSAAYQAIVADTSGSVAFNMPEGAVILRAVFEEKPVYAVTLNGATWGDYEAGATVTVAVDAEAFKCWAEDYQKTLGLSDWTQTMDGEFVTVSFTMPELAEGSALNLDMETYTLVNNVDLSMDEPTSADFDADALNLAALADAEGTGGVVEGSATLVDAEDAGAAAGDGTASLTSVDDEAGETADEKDTTFLLSIADEAENLENVRFARDLGATYNGQRVKAAVADDAMTATVEVPVGIGEAEPGSNGGNNGNNGSSSGKSDNGTAGAADTASSDKGAATASGKKPLPKSGDATIAPVGIVLAAVAVLAAGIVLYRRNKK